MLAVWSGPRQLAGHPGAAPGPGSQQDTAPPIQHKGTGPVAAAAAQGPGPMVEGPGRGTGGHRREREREGERGMVDGGGGDGLMEGLGFWGILLVWAGVVLWFWWWMREDLGGFRCLPCVCVSKDVWGGFW